MREYTMSKRNIVLLVSSYEDILVFNLTSVSITGTLFSVARWTEMKAIFPVGLQIP